MAVGTTENLSSGVLRFTPDQQRIAVQTIDIFNQLLKGTSGARINPSEAIPPSGDMNGVSDASPGIGAVIDFQA